MATNNAPRTSIFMHRIPLPSPPGPNRFSPLRQNLNLFNLIMTGMAATTFVVMAMSGLLVGEVTGVGAFACFLLAGFVSIFPGACFVEFATRMPSAGSVYTYTYATVGESIAFLIGWSNFWDFVFQAALAAKSISNLIDRMSLGVIRQFFINILGHFPAKSTTDTTASGHHLFDSSPDLMAAILLFTICIVLIFSVEVSVTTFNILAAIFLVGLLVIVSSCFVFGSPENLVGPQAGPFLIHGYSGIFRGASIILFAFMFYESISVASEEASHPQRDVPRASLICLVTITLYLILSALSVAYLQPHRIIDIESPFISGFQYLRVDWLKWFTFSVSVLALVTNCLATLYAASRYFYAMARDGLLPKFIAYLHRRFQTPIFALCIGTLLSMVLAVFFDIIAISKMSQIGSVLSFFIIGVDLIVVRYMPLFAPDPAAAIRDGLQLRPRFKRFASSTDGQKGSWMKQPMFFSILILTEIFSIFFATIVFTMYSANPEADILWASGAISTVVGLVIFAIMCMYRTNDLPEGDSKPFIVPLLPLVPVLAMSLSLMVATHLPAEAWVRLVVLSLIGFIIYFIQCLINTKNAKIKQPEPDVEEEEEDNVSEISSPLFSESSISRRNSLE